MHNFRYSKKAKSKKVYLMLLFLSVNQGEKSQRHKYQVKFDDIFQSIYLPEVCDKKLF